MPPTLKPPRVTTNAPIGLDLERVQQARVAHAVKLEARAELYPLLGKDDALLTSVYGSSREGMIDAARERRAESDGRKRVQAGLAFLARPLAEQYLLGHAPGEGSTATPAPPAPSAAVSSTLRALVEHPSVRPEVRSGGTAVLHVATDHPLQGQEQGALSPSLRGTGTGTGTGRAVDRAAWRASSAGLGRALQQAAAAHARGKEAANVAAGHRKRLLLEGLSPSSTSPLPHASASSASASPHGLSDSLARDSRHRGRDGELAREGEGEGVESRADAREGTDGDGAGAGRAGTGRRRRGVRALAPHLAHTHFLLVPTSDPLAGAAAATAQALQRSAAAGGRPSPTANSSPSGPTGPHSSRPLLLSRGSGEGEGEGAYTRASYASYAGGGAGAGGRVSSGGREGGGSESTLSLPGPSPAPAPASTSTVPASQFALRPSTRDGAHMHDGPGAAQEGAVGSSASTRSRRSSKREVLGVLLSTTLAARTAQVADPGQGQGGRQHPLAHALPHAAQSHRQREGTADAVPANHSFRDRYALREVGPGWVSGGLAALPCRAYSAGGLLDRPLTAEVHSMRRAVGLHVLPPLDGGGDQAAPPPPSPSVRRGCSGLEMGAHPFAGDYSAAGWLALQPRVEAPAEPWKPHPVAYTEGGFPWPGEAPARARALGMGWLSVPATGDPALAVSSAHGGPGSAPWRAWATPVTRLHVTRARREEGVARREALRQKQGEWRSGAQPPRGEEGNEETSAAPLFSPLQAAAGGSRRAGGKNSSSDRSGSGAFTIDVAEFARSGVDPLAHVRASQGAGGGGGAAWQPPLRYEDASHSPYRDGRALAQRVAAPRAPAPLGSLQQRLASQELERTLARGPLATAAAAAAGRSPSSPSSAHASAAAAAEGGSVRVGGGAWRPSSSYRSLSTTRGAAM